MFIMELIGPHIELYKSIILTFPNYSIEKVLMFSIWIKQINNKN